jgi:hypothetical protein
MASGRIARSFHYRSVCDKLVAKGQFEVLEFPCSRRELRHFRFKKDMTVWKYKKELQTAMADVMNVLTQDAC